MVDRDAKGRWLPGKLVTPCPWQPGQSGNPSGIPKLRREFERKFYAAMLEEETHEAAMTALKAAIREGAPWALNLYFSKCLPIEPLKVEVAPDTSLVELRNVIVEALRDHPEAQYAVAARLLALDRKAIGNGESE
jgi:hypothetical protein